MVVASIWHLSCEMASAIPESFAVLKPSKVTPLRKNGQLSCKDFILCQLRSIPSPSDYRWTVHDHKVSVTLRGLGKVEDEMASEVESQSRRSADTEPVAYVAPPPTTQREFMQLPSLTVDGARCGRFEAFLRV